MTTERCELAVKNLLRSIAFFILLDIAGLTQSGDLTGAVVLTAYAQSATAVLSGTVVDETDAVIPQSSVSVKGIKGEEKQALTSGDGSFRVTPLPPGSYTVAVQRQGFATVEIKDIELKADDRLTLKVKLRAGNIGEVVTVEAGSAVVPRSPALSTVVDHQAIENLPLNGRSIQPLIALAPGVVLTKATFTEQGQFSAGGGRANANYFMVDGVSANIGVAAGAGLGQSGAGSLPGLSIFGSTNNLFSIDALQEIRIQTSTYAPEFGRTPGAQVLITTRSGTNRFHGRLFEHFRDDALGANDWFANREGLQKPALRFHNFGGVLGGPVIKDHTFFFFSYEGTRLRLPQVTTVDVPSVAARRAAPPSVRPWLNAFPVPNGGDTVNGLARFSTGYSDSLTSNATSLRVDHRMGEKLTLFGRYNHAPSELLQRGAGGSLNTLLHAPFTTQTLTVGATYTITPKIINDFRVNYSRNRARRIFRLDDFGGAVPLDDSLVFPSYASRQDSVYTFSLGSGLSFSLGRDIDNLQRQVNLVNNLSVVTNAHQLKFGIDHRKLSPLYGQRKHNQTTTFNGVLGSLTGQASSISILTQDRVLLNFINFSAYAQDTWRATRRLTMTYGLRWEFNPPPSGEDEALFTAEGLTNPATLALAPQGTPFHRTTYNNFAPRFGMAYQLRQTHNTETVLRGGFGIFYDLGAGPVANAASYFPYVRRKVLFNVAPPLDAAQTLPRPFSLNPPVTTVRVFSPDFKLPYTLQWNVALDQSLGSSQNVSASYAGAAGRRLFRSEALLNPNPNFFGVFVATNEATSDYHALQLQYNRRLSRGLQALASYTWSRSIDIASNDSSFGTPSGQSDPRLDRGPSDFDVRHSLTATATYNIPAAAKGMVSRIVLRDWSLDTLVTARTATPVDVFTGRDLGFGSFNSRPDPVPEIPIYLDDASVPGGRVINRAAFAVPATSRKGTLRRNSLRGFPMSQVDFALRRQFTPTERFNLQFRIEFFNVFNHPNFGDPVGDLGSGLFGRSTSMLGRSLGSGGINGGLNPLYQVGGPRFIQLTVKSQF